MRRLDIPFNFQIRTSWVFGWKGCRRQRDPVIGEQFKRTSTMPDASAFSFLIRQTGARGPLFPSGALSARRNQIQHPATGP